MRTLILLAFCMLLLFSHGFGAQESYPRPWENDGWIAENEHIMDLGVWEFWYVIEPTANISQMDALGVMLPFHESLEESGVEALFRECTALPCAAVGSLGTAVRYKQWADEMIAYTRLGQVAAVMPPSAVSIPVEAGYSWNLYNYIGNWKGAMDNALLAAEQSGAEVNGRRAALESLLASIMQSGVCDPGYAGPGTGLCFIVVDDVACNSSGLWDSIPDMGWYTPCMHGHWSTASVLEEKYANASALWSSTIYGLYALKAAAEEKRADAAGAVDELSGHDLDKIYVSAESTDVSGVASIRNEYGRIAEEYLEANSLMKAAEGSWGSRGSGWYKEQYSALLSASRGYEDVAESSAALLEDARAVVDNAGRLARADLDAAARMEGRLTQNGQWHIELARAACSIADAEVSLGRKFEKYNECRMHARIAARNLEMENSTEFALALAEAESVVGKAEADGIDTVMEKALLRIVKEKKPANSIQILYGIRNGLVEKAEIRYSGLPEERKELLSIIESGGRQLEFLRTWFEKEECYFGEELDYRCALGNLGKMESSYSRIRDEIFLRSRDAVENSMLVDYHETTTSASLGGESTYNLLVKAKNMLDIGAENVVFSVPAGAELRGIDIISGRERVRTVVYEDGAATIQLYNIGPGEEIMLEFSRNYTPCTTSDYRESAVGDIYGGAKITETMELHCTNRVDSIYVGDDVERASLDGRWHEVLDGMLRAKIAAGRHDLSLVKEVPDAYATSKGAETVTAAGIKTTVEYMVEIVPAMDLDYVPVWVDESSKKPEKIEIFSYSGERISNKHEAGGVVYFEVNGLREGKPAKMRVRYVFSNSQEYVERRLSELENKTLGWQAQAYLNNATALYAAGDYNGALAALDELEAQIDKENKAMAKLLEKHYKLADEISRKVAELEEAIAAAERDGVANNYVDEMRARKGYLEEMLAKNISPAATESPLEDVDLGWEGRELRKIEKYLKDMEKKIKKEWMALGIDDRNLSEAVASLEEKNAAFSGTMKFVDGVEALAALQKAEESLQSIKSGEDAARMELENALGRVLEEAKGVAVRYAQERNAIPRGHRLVSLFTKSPAWIENRLDALGRSRDVEAAISEASDLRGEMNGIIDFLRGESERLSGAARELYKEIGAELGESQRSEVETALGMGESYYSQKQYAKAILAYESALDALQRGAGDEDDGILILAVTALLVIGVVLFLLLGKARPRLPKSGHGQMRRLKRVDYKNELSFD